MKKEEFLSKLPGNRLRKKALRNRLLAVSGLFILSVAGVGLRLYLMQGRDSDYYKGKVTDQLTSERTVSAKRGSIYSASGEILATDVATYRIFIDPQAIIDAKKAAEQAVADAEAALSEARTALREAENDPKADTGKGKKKIAEAKAAVEKAEKKRDDAEKDPKREADVLIAEGLAGICGTDAEKILEMTSRIGSRDATVLNDADRALAKRVTDFRDENGFKSMIFAGADSRRTYLYDNLASQVIGFTGQDGYGLYGLELYYNSMLSGTDGKYVTAVDSFGREIGYEYSNYIPPEDGCDLHTTIDVRVQSILEEQLKKTYYENAALEGACGIVMNVKTGAVYAMATYPNFNPNSAWTLAAEYLAELNGAGLDPESGEYASMRAELLEKMWSNMAVSYTYIPGSTFKPVTTAIALDTGAVKLTDTFRCTGSIRIEDRLVYCSNHWGHGNLTFAEGLQQSCNPWFITAGVAIGSKSYYDYVENFGYFLKSGIDLPGEGGTIFWSREGFTKINLAMCAFGQNFKVSPIRHLASVSSIANSGYLVQPYIVESITDSDGKTVMQHEATTVRQVISKSVSKTVATVLAEGVAGNGGSRNAYVAGYRVAAKTGTSEKIGEKDEENKICSCFAFAPYDDPEIAILLIVDAPTALKTPFGSTVAAPYVSAALSEILPYFNISPVYTPAEQAKLSVEIGSYLGKSSSEAAAAIEKTGLKVKTVGVGTVVTSQVPEAGTLLQKDSGTVVLYVGESAPVNNKTVPNLVGMSAAAARSTLLSSGFNIVVKGTTNYETGSGAVVFDQFPDAGTRATEGETVTVTFRYMNLNDD
ncbi:MAG: PASTA domain-containing protein [Clostridia bacterium]|nr:PASTA domain-containing protein [Clostridia bacterium]